MAEQRYKKVCLRLAPTLIEKLKVVAEENGIGYNELVRQALDEFLNAHAAPELLDSEQYHQTPTLISQIS